MKKELIQLYDEFVEEIEKQIREIELQDDKKMTLDGKIAYINSFQTFNGFIKWLKKSK